MGRSWALALTRCSKPGESFVAALHLLNAQNWKADAAPGVKWEFQVHQPLSWCREAGVSMRRRLREEIVAICGKRVGHFDDRESQLHQLAGDPPLPVAKTLLITSLNPVVHMNDGDDEAQTQQLLAVWVSQVIAGIADRLHRDNADLSNTRHCSPLGERSFRRPTSSEGRLVPHCVYSCSRSFLMHGQVTGIALLPSCPDPAVLKNTIHVLL